jgi:hypothetical protein
MIVECCCMSAKVGTTHILDVVCNQKGALYPDNATNSSSAAFVKLKIVDVV